MARTKQKNAKGGAPISSHPAFPAIVALWFAALFGIGSMVVPSALLENASVSLGLPALIEAAAPPLGFTARALLAAAVAAIGLLLGLWLARKVAAAQAEPKERSRGVQLKEEDRHPDAPAKRPISARQELGGEGLGRAKDTVADPWKFEDEWADDEDDDADGYGYDDEDYDDEYEDEGTDEAASEPLTAPSTGPGALPGRRRALAVTDDSGPSDFLHTVPLPGDPDPFGEQAVDDEPLELDVLEVEEPGDDAAAAQDFAAETDALRNTVQPSHDAVDFAATPAPEPLGMTNETDAEPAPLAEPAGSAPAPAVEHPVAAPQAHDSETSFVQDDAMTQAPSMQAAAPAALADLGTAELVERFARALKQRREQADAAPQAVSPSGSPTPMPVADGANPFADRAAELDGDAGMPAMPHGLPFTSPLTMSPEPEAEEAFAAPQEREEEPVSGPTDDAAPMVFRRSGMPAMEETAKSETQEQAFGQPRAMPSALQPVGFDEDDEDGDEAPPFSLDLGASRSFAPTAGGQGSEMPAVPQAFAPPVQDADDTEDDDGSDEDAYSSLLSMKSKLAGEQFARVEDDNENEADHGLPEPVVVFPGQEGGRFSAPAEPAPDQAAAMASPMSDTGDGARPFDGPGAASTAASHAPGQGADASETEKALREALEKLQRMSGAA